MAQKAKADTLTTWIAPTGVFDSRVSIPQNASYTSTFGLAFLAGNGSPDNTIDWISLALNTASVTTGSGSLRVALRNATNNIAYSAVAGDTEYAMDLISFTAPTSTNADFSLNLTSADIPNISSYAMTADEAYSLIIYNASASFSLWRVTGYPSGTTNDYYTQGSGFVMLDTFRNNSPNYANTLDSHPAIGISFGSVSGQQQEVPGPLPVLGAAAAFRIARKLRQRTKSVA